MSQIGREEMALNSCLPTGMVDGSDAGCEDMGVSDVAVGKVGKGDVAWRQVL